MKVGASGLSNGVVRAEFERSLDETIDKFLDDYCGTRPPGYPRPWPGPPPWIYSLAAGLTVFANTFQPGALQTATLEVASQVLGRAGSVAPASEARG
jgi:hypothetical protein